MDEERFWIDCFPLKCPYGTNTFGIVDEKEGGIIAYVGSEDAANSLVELLKEREQ